MFLLPIIFIGTFSYAQTLDKGCVDVEGIREESFPKMEELERVFGPIISKQYVVSDLGGYNELVFDGIVIMVDDEYGMDSFEVTSSKYEIMSSFGVGFYIGDSIETLSQSNYPFASFNKTKSNQEFEEYVFYLKNSDRMNVVKVKDGRIISFFTWMNWL